MGSKDGLSVPETSEDSVEVRPVPRRDAGTSEVDGGSDGDRNRSGLQREPLQFGPRSDDLAFACLASFVKELLRNTVNGDMVVFALHGVKRDVPLTDEQAKVFQAAMVSWWKRNKVWPEGF